MLNEMKKPSAPTVLRALLLVGLLSLMMSCGSSSDDPGKPAAQLDEVRGEAIVPIVEASAVETEVVGEPIEAPEVTIEQPPAPEQIVESAGIESENTVADLPLMSKIEVPEEDSEDADGVTKINFETLASFEYDIPEGDGEPVEGESLVALPMAADKIPEKILAYNDKTVALEGFMLPLKVEKGLVTELLILRDQSACCYGAVPKINEWVSVRMVDEGVKPVMDEPITMYGKLKVGEVRENGYLVGIYEMDGHKMIGPLGM
jgi:hypothetical protein